ncbi:MAG: hypothetical protein ACPLW7_01220 [Minisyncoccia bacterium]
MSRESGLTSVIPFWEFLEVKKIIAKREISRCILERSSLISLAVDNNHKN